MSDFLYWHRTDEFGHKRYKLYRNGEEVKYFIFRDKYDHTDSPYTVQLSGGSEHGFAKEVSCYHTLTAAKADIQARI